MKQTYPAADCSLDFASPFQLLVATMLSAQCTDVQVNKVTPRLFALFPDALRLSQASLAEIEALIRSTGFYHNKAKNLLAMSQMLIERHGGEVPQTMAELTALPGVGRKTANVVLGNAFGQNAGFVVDTHVFRLAHRLGLAQGTTPEKVEQELMKVFPQSDWAFLSHALILLGRETCKARKPDCSQCRAKAFCPKCAV